MTRSKKSGGSPDGRTPAPLTRRAAIRTGAAAALAAPFVARPAVAAAARPVRIGYVTPRTGTLAAFSEADPFVLDQVRSLTGTGLSIGGIAHPVQILTKDSQSNPNRAADVAADLILGGKVDLLLAASTPDTTNPVADQAEVNGVPCITTDCPWQPYFFGRNGDPAKGFEWTYHFFWGLEDVIAAFTALWGTVQTNKVVGGLFPNEADANAWVDPKFGFPPALARAGFKLVDGGRYQPLSNDFTAQISAFKAAGVQIVTGTVVPPDFATFWSQSAQQGFRPRVVTVGKALLFPSAVESLGPRGDGLSCEVWWTPHHPFRSGLSGQTAAELCAAYTKASGKPWTQPLGFRHALFEVAFDVLKRTKDLDDPASIITAVKATEYASIVGPIRWSGQPVRNVTKTPLVTGQWSRASGQADLQVVNDATAPEIPTSASLSLLA